MCDFSQAFNSIEKNVLLSKLMNDFKFEPWYICIVREIFRNRVFRFKNDNKYYEMSRGTCQGSVLGGLFYSLYSDNLSSRVSCNILSYADDVILYAKGTDADVVLNDLIMQLESVCEWCDENGIKLNFAKTKFMIFHKEHDKTGISDKLCFEIRNETIERVNEFKYLGIWIDPHLNFKKHFDVVCEKVASKLKYLRGFKRYINEHVLKVVINAYVHSVIDYGIEIWAVQSDAMLIDLQRKIDRFIIEFFYRKESKKKYNVTNSRCHNEFDVNTLRKSCNFMTVMQRRGYVILKCAYKEMMSGNVVLSGRSDLRKCPLMSLGNFSSQIFRKSVKYRTIMLWNKLPRDFDIKSMSYNKFKVAIHEKIFED